MSHVHQGSTLHWNLGQLSQHLREDHGMTVPMAWDLGQLHQAHLRTHQTSEETVLPKTEDPAIQLDEQAQQLFLEQVPGGDWNDTRQETRDYWRNQVKLRVNRLQPNKADTDRQILRDRIIAAMAGVDFDQDWAADSGMGPNGRGALRQAYKDPANRMLDWLERGGAMVLPQYASLGAELETEQSIRSELEEVNADLASRSRSAQAKWAEANRELEETRQRLGAAMEAGSVLERQRDEANARQAEAVEQWQSVVRAYDGLASERDSLVQRLAQVEGDAQHLDQLASRVQRERDQADYARYQAQQQIARLERTLNTRTQALATGQVALGELISELEREGWTESTVYRRLEEILAGSRLAAGLAVVEQDDARLGCATTGELIEEVRTRIDLGHCGLGYRTADDE